MTQSAHEQAKPGSVILFIDEDVVARTAVASYLRECGYAVIEASSDDEARTILSADKYDVDIAICDLKNTASAEMFALSHWIRTEYPHVRVLIAATLEKTAKLASHICEEGAHLRKPYEHQALLDWIKRLRQ